MYAEYGHEDHNADIRDLESEPDHSRIAMVGFRKTFLKKRYEVQRIACGVYRRIGADAGAVSR